MDAACGHLKRQMYAQKSIVFRHDMKTLYRQAQVLMLHQLGNMMLCYLQSSAIDIQAMAMAMAVCWTPPLGHMTPHKPPPCACGFGGQTLLVLMAVGCQLSHTWNMVFLSTRPWYKGGNGTAHLVSVHACLDSGITDSESLHSTS